MAQSPFKLLLMRQSFKRGIFININRWHQVWKYQSSLNAISWCPKLSVEDEKKYFPSKLSKVPKIMNSLCLKIAKKSHSTLRAKRATLHFEWPKINYKCQKNNPFGESFWKPEACGQTLLPDWIKIGENAKFLMRHFE